MGSTGSRPRRWRHVAFHHGGKVIAIEFGTREWFDLVADLYVRSIRAGELELDNVELRDDLWADELYHLFFSGAPCIAIRNGELVALTEKYGPAWAPPKPWSRNRSETGYWSADLD